jgi:hypothetical protein
MERMAMSAPTPCRIWFVTGSDLAKDEAKRISSPCSYFQRAAKAGIIDFSSASFITEKP